VNKRKIQELYREQMAEKNEGKNYTKSLILVIIACIITLLWIGFFDGQLTDDYRVIKIEKIE